MRITVTELFRGILFVVIVNLACIQEYLVLVGLL